MKRIIFGLITFLLIVPVKTYECSNSDKEGLQKLANNITISLENKADSKENESGKNDNNNKFTFLTFYKKYYWPFMIGLVAILTLLFLWVKQNKKNKL